MSDNFLFLFFLPLSPDTDPPYFGLTSRRVDGPKTVATSFSLYPSFSLTPSVSLYLFDLSLTLLPRPPGPSRGPPSTVPPECPPSSKEYPILLTVPFLRPYPGPMSEFKTRFWTVIERHTETPLGNGRDQGSGTTVVSAGKV